ISHSVVHGFCRDVNQALQLTLAVSLGVRIAVHNLCSFIHPKFTARGDVRERILSAWDMSAAETYPFQNSRLNNTGNKLEQHVQLLTLRRLQAVNIKMPVNHPHTYTF